ncbi:MAG TPA: TRAP transporter fused permease subunit [Burkholderiales bacterium]|jgi:TRAP transporter 4TM/12TM fusion protein|nr:TRAP transporter fused permease subunit [Burkholderiales bacterium]
MTDSRGTDTALAVDALYYGLSIVFSLAIFYYYWTGAGGPSLLAMTVVPVVFVLFVLQALRQDDLYPALPRAANYAIAAAYCAFSLYCGYYMNHEYMPLGLERAGAWNTMDMVMGGGMALLIIEYTRKRHMPLFILNIVLILYAVYGYVVPGMFYHAGVSWERVVTASSVEMATGIFSRLPQLALTTIGAFLLVLSLLRGYGCIESLLRATKRVAVRSAHAIPQSAVVGSMAIGTVSGSGAANSITVGSATIPSMINAGLPPATAAAIECASSMGGQLMPPVMGIAAFLMAEFLGVDYFDVVARGWVPAFIYYATVSTSVYLLAVKHRAHMIVNPNPERLSWRDKVNLGAFVFVVGGLVALMAAIFLAPMFAALYMFCTAGAALFVVNLVPLLKPGRWSWREFFRPLREFLDSYIDMIADITLLLATLSIMTGVLVITGVPTKLGALLMDAAGVNVAAMVLMAFIFGVVLGTGLPPAPTYIIVAIVIAPPMIQAGVNPWVVHFFAFFLAVFGELTPPTSITAAITSKIADASFYTTLWRAILICISLFTLMAGVFVHPQLVVQPGAAQIGAALLIGISTVGLTFAFQAQFADRGGADLAARAALAAAALVGLLSPNEELGGAACVVVAAMIGYWLVKRRLVKPLAPLPASAATGSG